jgi:hypothetical protein
MHVEADDIHAKVMRNYPEVPDWLYLSVLLSFRSNYHNRPPEVDINNNCITELFMPLQVEPDPFSAHTNTYYTPQTMRHLEEEPEGSRQESMERSVMDEASGEKDAAHPDCEPRAG